MNKKILVVSTLILLFVSFITSLVTGQNVIRFQPQRASDAEDILFREHFKEYRLGILPTKATSDLLRSRNSFDQMEIEVEGKIFSFNLQSRDIRPSHYKLRVMDDTGIHEMPRSPNKTYSGFTTQGGYDVRITADDQFFNAVIEQSRDEFYIEAARNIVPDAPKDLYVMYWATDNLKRFTESACGVTQDYLVPQPHGEDHSHDQDISQDRSAVCKVVQVALANDFEMFQQEGSVTEVENHNLAVINNVETNYDDEFSTDLQFDIVEIFVATTNGNDPWTNSADAGDLLDDFTDWGPSGFSNVHDVAGLWTNRDFNGDVVGLAWVGAICTNVRYHTVQDFTSNSNFLRCLQSHEMGHNFNADHDAVGAPHIMAPSVQNTNTWSSASVNTINAYIPTRSCLTVCGSGSPPVADFDADETEGCVPFQVHFTDQSSNSPTSWNWSFPGGSPATSTAQNPTITYNNPGVYDVSLTASNSHGSNMTTQQDFIIVGDDPLADFDYSIDELFVDFENLSEDATSYIWDFGDGNNSTQTNPIHEYAQDGVYDVTLTAVNDCGTDIITIEIEILTLPFADFDADPTEGCEPLEVEFYNYSSPNSNSFLWSFPGGSPPTSTAFEPVIVYETPGTYSVTLTAINDAGQDVSILTNFITILAQPLATFTYEADGLEATFSSTGSIGDTYNWNFGDGNVSSQPNPVHIYAEGGAYTVTLTVTNDCGTDVHSAQVIISSAPVAQFTAEVTSGCAPLVVQYENLSVGEIISYNWIFQGGSPATSTNPNPLVTYNNPGVFDVTLTVTNSVGNDVQFNDNFITVHPLPVSGFDYIINGMQVTFTNESSNATSWTWNFGDGLFSDDENPVHTYLTDGVYTVTLVSTGVCGSDTSTSQVIIQSVPVADFSFQQNADCVPATVQFTNQSSSNVTAFKWTFEGGSPMTSTQANPLVTYNIAGTYDVQLIVFAPAGNDTLNMPSIINVGVGPNADFLFSNNGTDVEFENLSSNANSFEWLFGDGQTSTETHPFHSYQDYGTYTIFLIAVNDCGNDTMSVVIELGTVPNASFTSNVQNGCAPFEVQFIDQSQNNPTSWLWMFEGGNPSTSTLQHPVVVYETPGSYSATLQVTNSEGTDVLMLSDVIHVANPPDASFDITIDGNLVSLSYEGTDFDSLNWDFGDGRLDNSLNPTVDYPISGWYQIMLTVFNACGVDTHSVMVNIEITSTKDPESNIHNWQLRPSPFSDQFSIYGEPLKTGTVLILLWDVSGTLISKEEWTHGSGPVTKKLSSAHLPAGVILVQITDQKSSVILRGVHQD